MRYYVVGRLLAEHYDVTAVPTARRGRWLPRWLSLPDLVLTDIMMPGVDCFGVLRPTFELRAHPREILPVILLSARAGE